ncbi:MAG: GNAT family N-acetyltransferase [Actinomycetota bacterium]
MTDRLWLRPIQRDDLELLVDLDGDPAVMRYLTGGRASTAAEVEAEIERSADHRRLGFLRDDAAEAGQGVETAKRFVGWFGLRPGPGSSDRELGYRCRRSMWGQGLATEGARAVIEAGFANPAVNRIWAQTMAVNQASRRVMERCGLRYVKTFHVDWDEPITGAEHGEVLYERHRSVSPHPQTPTTIDPDR